MTRIRLGPMMTDPTSTMASSAALGVHKSTGPASGETCRAARFTPAPIFEGWLVDTSCARVAAMRARTTA
ncbi:hypothetical protein [Caballeronia sp.]|uniref:hypothetical protein n=1 Tax=Caballeronia sp. TaxID=1931223 RepID=UPI0026304D6E|nr:hypothetical protein [Caballeronia sp.]